MKLEIMETCKIKEILIDYRDPTDANQLSNAFFKSMRLKTSLRDYQRQAVDKLIHIKVCALYMEMGTGKTRTALELIQRRLDSRKIDRAIWLCPTSETVKRNLRKDFDKHADGWEQIITLCGIETLSTSVRENRRLLQLASSCRCFLVVDESLMVKNPYALRSIHITRLAERCPYRLLLNGTPVSRNLADLFSQWYILDWRILGYRSYWSFAANHLEYDEVYKNKIRRVLHPDYLTDKIAPYAVQISKSDVLNLPPKHYLTQWFSLTEDQEAEYCRVRDDFLSLEALYESPDSPLIYRTFNALQQVTSGQFIATPARLPMRHFPMFLDPEDNPRIQALITAINTYVPRGEKAVIWCKYTHEILDISQVLRARGEQVSLCYGDVTQKRRAEELKKFESSARFFIANKGCAGFSLNLQYCHYMIFYNNDWDWATRAQAEDRIHRSGQAFPVEIVDICAVSKIDERILLCVNRKENMAHEFRRMLNSKNLTSWLDGKDDLKDDTIRAYGRPKTDGNPKIRAEAPGQNCDRVFAKEIHA